MQRIIIKIKVFILQDYRRFALVLTKKGLDNDEHIWSNWVIGMNLPCLGHFMLLPKNLLAQSNTFSQHWTQQHLIYIQKPKYVSKSQI